MPSLARECASGAWAGRNVAGSAVLLPDRLGHAVCSVQLTHRSLGCWAPCTALHVRVLWLPFGPAFMARLSLSWQLLPLSPLPSKERLRSYLVTALLLPRDLCV